MRTNKLKKLTLVGAGPGDPELITIKGVKALASADVVLYDSLTSRELLNYAPDAIKIFVGKRKGYHKYSQDRINELIVENAFNYGHVVRLKGGDPFIFGRGAEEIEYAESFGLEVDTISGITSAIAVPASLGISLTQRKVAQSFWVITGTTTENKLSKDIHLAAKSTATIVILMGMSKLSQVVATFQNEDKGDIPVAIIQNGTTVNENTGIGTINSIEEVVKEKSLSSPAIIVIGEVVRESHKLRSFYQNYSIVKSDYQDKSVLLT